MVICNPDYLPDKSYYLRVRVSRELLVPPNNPSGTESHHVFRVAVGGEETTTFQVPESSPISEFMYYNFGECFGKRVHDNFPIKDLGFTVSRTGSREGVPDEVVTIFLDGFLRGLNNPCNG